MRAIAPSHAFCAVLLAMLAPRVAAAAPSVWAIDDGEKIKQDQTSLPLATGVGNPVWSPGESLRLFAMRNETVAFQIVVAADAAPLGAVTVELAELSCGSASIANAPGATDPTTFVGRPIERFVEHYFDVTRPSGNTSRPSESLGWASGSGPSPGLYTGMVPDALIPVEVAPSWDPYPMHVAAGKNAAVWVDVTVPKTQPSCTYQGTVVVKDGATTLASIPVSLEVVDVTLPDRPVKTMLYYSRGELSKRIGDAAAAEKHLWQLYHRHRMSPMHGAKTASDAQGHLPALDGSIYTAANGYEGPGEGLGDGVLSLGTYGSYGTPSATTLASVEGVADLLAQKGLFGTTDVFVYAIDESCGSTRGQQWVDLLAGSKDANARSVRVGWTCSQNPASQPVDLPIVFASSFDPQSAAAAKAKGKDVWVYNGSRPQTGTFLTDTEAVSLRVNGWLDAMFDMGRWFYWETTFWYDDNNGGHGAYDPWVTPETFHNGDGDYCEGDGVLVYPGKQVDQFTEHSLGMSGVVASIRLKNFRRGIEDAGYYQLAHAAAPAEAEAIAQGLLPKVLTSTHDGQAVSWSASGEPFFAARKALLGLIPHGLSSADAGAGGSGGEGGGGAAGGPGAGGGALDAGAAGAPGSGGGSGGGSPGNAGGAGGGSAAPAPGADAPGVGAPGAGGCGCRTTGGPARGAAALGAVLGCSMLAMRRRRRARRT